MTTPITHAALLPAGTPHPALRPVFKVVVVLIAGLVLYIAASHDLPSRARLIREHLPAIEPLLRILAAAGSVVVAAQAWRLVLWLRYRPMRLTPDEAAALPSVVVLIPAFNEGERVAAAIDSVFEARYPSERLRVIAIDDGSRDDTLDHLRRAALRHGERLEVIALPTNGGKRMALEAGFAIARAEIVVTMDSDSTMDLEALRCLVVPMLRDPDVACVAGKVIVDNREDNLITRMLGVRYVVGFDFTRAYQSMLGTVVCSPGAASAYRRSALDRVRPRWLGQTFLGRRCVIGDDRALTNELLRDGHATRYQGNAIVRTRAPSSTRGLVRMYLRWARSNVRETLRLGSLAPRRVIERRAPLMALDLLAQALALPVKLGGVALAYACIVLEPSLLLDAAYVATNAGLISVACYLRSDRSSEAVWGLLYSYYALFVLLWIDAWAALTVRENRWLTRA